MVYETGSIVIAPRAVRDVQGYLYDNKGVFDVEIQGKVNELGILKLKGEKIILATKRGNIHIHKQKMNKDVKVFLHPTNKSVMKLQLVAGTEKDPEVSFVLKCEDSNYRDIVALTVSFFAKKYRK